MKFPIALVRRATLDNLKDTLEVTARAEKKSRLALEMAFGVSVQDVIGKDVKDLHVWVSDAVLEKTMLDPQRLMVDELHRSLDKIVAEFKTTRIPAR